MVYGDGTLKAGQYCHGLLKTQAGRKPVQATRQLAL
jgi:hypothetical protein